MKTSPVHIGHRPGDMCEDAKLFEKYRHIPLLYWSD